MIIKSGGQHDKFCPPLFIVYPKSKLSTFYSFNRFIIVWFLCNFRYQFRIGNLAILADNHYRTCQQTGKRSVGHTYSVVFIKIGETEIRQRNHIRNTFRCTETCMCKRQILGDCQHYRIGQAGSQFVELTYRSSAHTGVKAGENIQNNILPGQSLQRE